MSKTYTCTGTLSYYRGSNRTALPLQSGATSFYAGCDGYTSEGTLHITAYYATVATFADMANWTFDVDKITAVTITVRRASSTLAATYGIGGIRWALLESGDISSNKLNLYQAEGKFYEGTFSSGTSFPYSVTKDATEFFDTSSERTTWYNNLKTYGFAIGGIGASNPRQMRIDQVTLSITVAEETIHLYYDKNTTEAVDNLPTTWSSSVTEPYNVPISSVIPTTTNYSFHNWNTAADRSGTSYSSGDTYPSLFSDVTLYAQWNKRIKVTYSDSTATPTIYSTTTTATTPDITSMNVTIATASVMTKQGYAMTGWKDGNGTTYGLGSSKTLSTNLSLYPIWQSISTIHYTDASSDWQTGQVKIYNGTSFVSGIIKIYNGSKWVDTI